MRRFNVIVTGLIVTVVLAVGIAAGYFIGKPGNEPQATPSPAASADEAADAPAPAPVQTPYPWETAPPVEPQYYEPKVDDFLITPVVVEKQCFGSAGCNVQFRVELTSLFIGELDPDATYELTYEVQGGEDPLINTLTLEGDEYSYDDREMVSTESSDDELTVVVVSVSKVGL